MPFLAIVAVVLVIACPIAGYELAMRAGVPQRWKVVLGSAAGGALAAVLYLGVLSMAGMVPTAMREHWVAMTLVYVRNYALFGLVLGFAGLVPRAAGLPRLIITGIVMVVLLDAVTMVVRARHPSPEQYADGVVVDPDNVPVPSVPVFYDHGSGKVERLTTDRTGVFHALIDQLPKQDAKFLICAPGAIPSVRWPVQHSLTPQAYQIAPLPPGSMVKEGIRYVGWRAPIPRECLVGSGDQ